MLAFLVWRVGTGPFLDGLRTVDGGALAAASGLAVLTTVCCAWRWRLVARGLGVDLPLGTAVAAYYRSIFLNVTLPGGVVGDVHRGVSHGRDTRDVGRGLRAVAWERSAGQAVQIVLTVAVLLVMPSPVRAAMPLVALALLAAAAGVALAAHLRPAVGRSRWARLRGAVARDLRAGLLTGRAWLPIALVSALVVAGHAVTFLIAARTAGVTASPSQLLPLALLVMLAAVLPNVGGWGPREGVTAWAFAAAGLGASRGVATAVVYGVMVFVASLPGAAVLVATLVRRDGAVGMSRPPVHPAELQRVARRLPRRPDAAPRAVERGRLRPGRRGARVLRRDHGRRGHRAQRQPAVARALAGPPPRADGPRAHIVADEDHRDRPGGPRRALELLHHRRGREARLHLEPAGGRRPRAARAGGDDRGRRPGACGCAGSARTSPTAAWSG